jgi:ABC-type phosphate transport system substrate-binding protein
MVRPTEDLRMRKSIKMAAGVGGLLTLVLGAAGPASADVQPNPGDVTGVGSDTVQYVADFVDNGYNATGTAINGYNTIPKVFKIFNFDATADAAGRAQYSSTGRDATGPFPSAIVLRAGGFPYYRAQGSGDGITDLLGDGTAPYKINFVRSSRLPKPSEQTTAGTKGFGPANAGLHVYRIATDGLDMAINNKAANVTSGDPLSCAPIDGLTVAELVDIYKGNTLTWGALANYGTAASPGTRAPSPIGTCDTEPIAAMHPDISKSGTGKDFDGDLKAANGAVAITYGPKVISVEEHDPAPLSVGGTLPGGGAYGPQDTLAPFSTGRYNLIQKGYFDHVMDLHGTTSAVYKDTIALQQAGVGSVAAGAYHKARTLFIIVRENDLTSATPFLPGGSQNFVMTFFGLSSSWYAKAANAAAFTAAGVTQSWADLGNASA